MTLRRLEFPLRRLLGSCEHNPQGLWSKFRKKPVVIKAFQITPETRNDNRDWPSWLNEAWQKDFAELGAFFRLSAALCICTLEGVLTVSDGDWIIQGVKGEIYPCKPDIFEATYEPVNG